MFLIDKITLIAVWIFSLNNYLVLGFIEFNNKAIFWLLGLQSMSEFINAFLYRYIEIMQKRGRVIIFC